jgi:BirA family transcriptional regulator, biotin operon repressor / biotin---[acetyl-CoA-carboxylase] ligase
MTLDQFTENDLRARLHLRPLRYFDNLDSTMDEAQAWLRTSSNRRSLNGAVVIADEQRRGRGRFGRTWHTPSGVALALSVILQPSTEVLHQITMLGALAICDLLAELPIDGERPHIGIKWANDVLLNGRKVSGVLSEAVWDNKSQTLLGVVLGMGVNIRVTFDDPLLSQKATSIEPEYGRSFQRADLIERLLTHIDNWAAQLGSERLFESWRSRLVTLGQPVTVTLPDGVVAGVADEVEPSGALWIVQEDGTRQRIIAGDLDMGN